MGTDSQVIVGVAQLYIAPSGSSIPAFADDGLCAPSSPWIAQGFSSSGVDLTVDAKIDEIRVEEQATPVTAVPDTVDVTIDITLAEDILSNALTAYGMAELTTVAATSSAPAQTVLNLSNALTELALCFVGLNVFGFNRLFYVPNVYSGGKVKTSYKRTKTPRMYPTTFTAICPLADITFIDATAVAT